MTNNICVLDDTKLCNQCQECLKCDLDPSKICDNCCKCLDKKIKDYESIIIDEIII